MANYLDGELSLEARALFDAHLDQCEPCSRELVEMRDTIRLLRTLPSEEPPATLVSDVMARIAEGEGQANWLGRALDQLSRYVVPRVAIPATAMAAALTLTVMSGDVTLDMLELQSRTTPLEVASTSTDDVDPASTRSVMPKPTRVATVTAQTRAQQLEGLRVVNPAPPLRYGSDTGAGSFLFRVANDHGGLGGVGPMRRQAVARDDPSRMLFMSGGSQQVVPFLGASAAPSIGLGGNALVAVSPQLPGSPRARAFSARGGNRVPSGIAPVAMSRFAPVPSEGEVELSREERAKLELDRRLDFLQEDPTGFAQQHAQFSLAERELWMRELAARAEEVGDGEVERVLSALEGSGDLESRNLLRDFSAAVEHNRATWAANEAAAGSD